MSAFKQKLARLGATAGVFAGSTAAVLAIAGIGASSASAAPTCVNIPAAARNLGAQGSTLQHVAQENWTGRTVPSAVGTPPYTALSPAKGYAKECTGSENATVSYAGTGSGAALKAFGFTGEAITKTSANAFVGSDEAPEAGQITTAKTKSNSVAPVIIPVAQTSIAVVANIPSACALKSEKGLTYAELNSLFAGTITKWSSLSNVANKMECEGAETGPIVRVVREDGSGTSFQFKNYLSVLETTEAASGPGKFGASCTTKKWSELRTTGEPNLTWPESTCNTGVTALHRVSGGGALAEYVAATPNTIGYVAYSDAVAHNAKPLELQNATGKTITYAAPGKVPSGGTNPTEANCSSRVYTVPAAGRAGSGTGLGVDWSAVFGAAPTAGGTLYPLCTLTYDVAWNGYNTVGYTEGAKVGEAVHAYLGYVLNEGQTILGTLGYQPLPETVAAENNVLGAAKLALTKVN